MICYEGTIITCNENNAIAGYLVEDGGKILYAGDTLPAQYQTCRRISLGDQALLPAFVDTHQHFASFATFHAGLNVMDAESNQEIADMIASFFKTCKNKTLIAFGASPCSVREGHLISRDELDKVCPDKPAMVVKYDGHACIINSLLLKKLQKKLAGLRGYHPDTGEMNQEAFFAVSNYITNSLSIVELVQNMQRAMDYMASVGIGTVHSVSGVGFPLNLDISLEKWMAASAQSGFQLRIFPQSMDIRTALRRKLPRIGGCFSNALDGCFGSRDAALLKPYEGSSSNGVLYYSDAQVADFCKEANRAGLQIELHAIGDAAFEQAARSIKAALDDYPRRDHRHGIIHACLPTALGLEICREYQIQLPVQTAFIDWKQEPDSYLESILGSRSSMLNPLQTMWNKGLILSAGSDAPCTAPNPIAWIHKACNHSNPSQALTLDQALRMCTYNGAWATFDEKLRGSLEAGKLADMVLLSANPYEVPRERLQEIQVRRLYLQGRPYQQQSRSAAGALLTGIFSRNAS
ncbi:amidohydrolase [Ruminococcus gauvreauii]|uniref:amidohydrolase n=1 Tax=Ruminococcus gauvreauii TaxID=438033 RepID=UPI003983EA31